MPHSRRFHLFDLLHQPHPRWLQHGLPTLRGTLLQRMRPVLAYEQPACRNPRVAFCGQRISRRITKPRFPSFQQQHQTPHSVLSMRKSISPQEERLQVQSLPVSLVRCSMRQGIRVTQLRWTSTTVQSYRQRPTVSPIGMHCTTASHATHRFQHDR
jgi:hypothetical protein